MESINENLPSTTHLPIDPCELLMRLKVFQEADMGYGQPEVLDLFLNNIIADYEILTMMFLGELQPLCH